MLHQGICTFLKKSAVVKREFYDDVPECILFDEGLIFVYIKGILFLTNSTKSPLNNQEHNVYKIP